MDDSHGTAAAARAKKSRHFPAAQTMGKGQVKHDKSEPHPHPPAFQNVQGERAHRQARQSTPRAQTSAAENDTARSLVERKRAISP